MRIAHVIDYFQPALGYQETYLAKTQLAEGHQVRVFTGDRYFPYPSYDLTYGNHLGPRKVGTGLRIEEGIPVTRLSTAGEVFDRLFLLGLHRALEVFAPDYLHVHSVTSFTAWQVAGHRFTRRPVLVFDDHMSGVTPKSMKREAMRWFYQCCMQRRIAAAADHVVAVSRVTRDYLREVLHFPEEKLAYIPLGYMPELFHPDAAARTEVRNDLGVSEHEVVGIYTGKLTRAKGMPQLAEALTRLKKHHPDLGFIYVGDGEAEVLELLSHQDPGARVVHQPFVSPERLNAWYCAADFGIWPDGATVSHLEAIACGLPIIVSPWKAVHERVEQGNGLALAAADSASIEAAIGSLLQEPQRRAVMAEAALRFSKQLSWAALSRQFLELALVG